MFLFNLNSVSFIYIMSLTMTNRPTLLYRIRDLSSPSKPKSQKSKEILPCKKGGSICQSLAQEGVGVGAESYFTVTVTQMSS